MASQSAPVLSPTMEDCMAYIKGLQQRDNPHMQDLYALGREIVFTPAQQDLFERAASKNLNWQEVDGSRHPDFAQHLIRDNIGQIGYLHTLLQEQEFGIECFRVAAVLRHNIDSLSVVLGLDRACAPDSTKARVSEFFVHLKEHFLPQLESLATAEPSSNIGFGGYAYLNLIDPASWTQAGQVTDLSATSQAILDLHAA